MVRLSSILSGSTSFSAKQSNPRSECGTAHAIVIVRIQGSAQLAESLSLSSQGSVTRLQKA